MINRLAYPLIQESLKHFPAVAILGPRQVGKTTLALELGRKRPSLYLDLELNSDLAKLSDPELYLQSHSDKLVILDEIQRAPELFRTLRSLIDYRKRQGRRTGQFLILGSASLDLLKQSSESLAGRIAYHELTPLLPLEVPKKIESLWLRGGFPESVLARRDRDSFHWRGQFIKTYLERDIPVLGPRIPAETLRRFWTMLAHRQMTLLNQTELARALGVDGKTVARYLDLFVDLLLVRRLSPWHKNLGKRLVKSPKVFIRDSGLVHALLNIENHESLLSHPVAGLSWEAFVCEALIVLAPQGSQSFFYRTSAGAEIDLILQLPNRQLWAIEIKRSLSPKISKGFFIGCEDIQPDFQFLVYAGHETYKLSNEVQATGILDLLRKLHVT